MELHQLRYFQAVADLGSFSRAADRCLVAQPSLSQQIIKLEREIKKPLFERKRGGVCLTEAGRVLYDQAAAILRTVDDIEARVVAATEPGLGTVRLGAIPTVAPYLLPRVLKSFSERFPRATVQVNENLTDFTVRSCLEGELDVGVIASPLNHERLVSEALFTEELRLALPRVHRLARRRVIRFADVAGEPFVLMNEVHCLGEQVIGFCKQQGCLPVVRCQSVQLLTIQELVAAGHGISLIPAMACGHDQSARCLYRSLTEPTPTRTIRVIRHKDRYQSPVAKEFIDALRAEFSTGSARLGEHGST